MTIIAPPENVIADSVNKDMATALSEIAKNSGQILDKKLLVKTLQRTEKAIADEQ